MKWRTRLIGFATVWQSPLQNLDTSKKFPKNSMQAWNNVQYEREYGKLIVVGKGAAQRVCACIYLEFVERLY
jgi:hypothetical protein